MTLEEAQARILELEAVANAAQAALDEQTRRNVELEAEITRVREFNNKLFLQVSQAEPEQDEPEPETEKTLTEIITESGLTL